MQEGRVRRVSRARWLVALTLGTLLLIPPALAWACNPQAHINLSATSFNPGQQITVYGSYFAGNRPINVAGPTGSVSVTSSAGGAFAVQMTAPTAAGNYVISASKPTGGSAPASFSVVGATQAAPATSVASQSVPSSSVSTAKSPSFSAPAVHASHVPVTHHAAAATSAPAATAAPVVPATVTPAPVVSATPVVSSAPAVASTPAATTHHAAARSSHPAKSTAPATSQLAATSNLWSGFASGRGASLTGGSAGSMSGGGTSSALTIGIAVPAIGLIALVAGLTGAEVRRRRLSAR